MAVYRVWARLSNAYYTDVEASSEDEAYEIANSMDIEDFYEETYSGDFEITEVRRLGGL